MKNKESKLGLPLEYQKMPEYFDAHNINEKTEANNALIEKLLSEQDVKTVFDMTCGTGSQVFYLFDHGYEVVGSDFSPDLIKAAREKAKKTKANISFIDGDMRTIKVGKFDAVITIFNAIGHLIKTDFEIALQNIHSNLNDHGIYIFDIFNLQAITDDKIDDFNMDIESIIGGDKIRNIQYSKIDKERGLLTSYDHYTITHADGTTEVKENTFSLQIYRADEIKTVLEKNGFKVIAQYDMDGNSFVPEKSLTILTVAKKV